jgi:hypothetical protein
MHTRARFALLAFITLVTGAHATSAQQAAADAAAKTITPEDMRARIAFLSDDSLKGRNTPSAGLTTAANYIAGQFKSFGLQPLGDNNGFLQMWPYRQAHLKGDVSIEARSAQGAKKLAYGSDFFLVHSEADSAVAGAVFGGSAKDAASIGNAARGNVVFFFLPGMPSPEWQQTASSTLMSSLHNGAKAIVLVLDPTFPPQIIGMITQQTAEARVPPGAPPLVGMTYAKAKEIFSAGGQDLDALKDKPGTTPLEGVTVVVKQPVESNETKVPNVVAVIPGSDPKLKDEYIVFSGHMDHIGVGKPDERGDSIYNGADDDASGTSVVMEVAQAFASMNQRPKRSLIFLTVSGEEKGLLGSDYFVNHPPIAISRIVADVNTDMIGRNNPDTVVAIGQDYSSLGPTLQSIAKAHPELHLTVAPDLWPEEGLFFRSDHFNFARNNVPAIFFTTGLHPDYHKPSDEVDKIDADKAARIARLVFYLGNEIANAPSAPKWTAKGVEDVKKMTQ